MLATVFTGVCCSASLPSVRAVDDDLPSAADIAAGVAAFDAIGDYMELGDEVGALSRCVASAGEPQEAAGRSFFERVAADPAFPAFASQTIQLLRSAGLDEVASGLQTGVQDAPLHAAALHAAVRSLWSLDAGDDMELARRQLQASALVMQQWAALTAGACVPSSRFHELMYRTIK